MIRAIITPGVLLRILIGGSGEEDDERKKGRERKVVKGRC